MNSLPDVQTLTPQEAQAELDELLQAAPDAPWESVPSLLWRSRKALLELWLVLHPVPNQAQNNEPESGSAHLESKPVQPPRKHRHTRHSRRSGVIA